MSVLLKLQQFAAAQGVKLSTSEWTTIPSNITVDIDNLNTKVIDTEYGYQLMIIDVVDDKQVTAYIKLGRDVNADADAYTIKFLKNGTDSSKSCYRAFTL